MPLREIYEKTRFRTTGWSYWRCDLGGKHLDRQLEVPFVIMNLYE